MTEVGKRPELPNQKRRPADAPTALGGIRVVDFTRMLSGPVGTMFLADLGAEVIKVENPQAGDDARGLKPPAFNDESATFLWANRNKKSIALDLRTSEGCRIAKALALKADVVVENFSTGIMERFGLSYDEIRKDNPKVIYCSVSAFGRQGAFAARPGYDPIVQAESGFFSLNGWPDQDPVRAGASVMDVSTGMMTCNTILGALVARERLGVGQYVEVALFDDAVLMTGQYGMNYLLTGEDQERFGNGSKTAEPVGLFQTANGGIYITCANDKNFQRLVGDVIFRPDLATNPDFATNALRTKNKAALHAILGDEFAKDHREVFLERGHKAGVPVGLVKSIAEAFNSEEVRDRGLLSQIPHPKGGMVPNIAPPFRLHGTPLVDAVAAPVLGQHTEEILQNLLGCDSADFAALKASGTFGNLY